MGDTGLELSSGLQLRCYEAPELLSGALRSSEIRPLKYRGKYHGPLPFGRPPPGRREG